MNSPPAEKTEEAKVAARENQTRMMEMMSFFLKVKFCA